MSDDKPFSPNSKHHFAFKNSGSTMGGMNASEDQAGLVICDLDMQPHGLNSHVAKNSGRRIECERPVTWTLRGVKAKEMDL